MENKITSWKVIATMSHTLMADYLFTIEEEARAFKQDMINNGYEAVMYEVKI